MDLPARWSWNGRTRGAPRCIHGLSTSSYQPQVGQDLNWAQQQHWLAMEKNRKPQRDPSNSPICHGNLHHAKGKKVSLKAGYLVLVPFHEQIYHINLTLQWGLHCSPGTGSLPQKDWLLLLRTLKIKWNIIPICKYNLSKTSNKAKRRLWLHVRIGGSSEERKMKVLSHSSPKIKTFLLLHRYNFNKYFFQ